MSKEKKGNKRNILVLTIILGTVILFGAGCFLLWQSSELEKTTNSKLSEYKQEKIELEKQAKNLSNQNSQTKEEVTVSLKSCSSFGQTVADCQNFYSTTQANASTEESREAIRENVEKMKSVFDSKVSVATAWYSSNHSDWVFNSTYSFTDTEIPVLWTCVGDSESGHEGDLFAYATGTYNNDTKLFSDISVHVTKLGKSLQPHD